jgi:hypothetical protein
MANLTRPKLITQRPLARKRDPRRPFPAEAIRAVQRARKHPWRRDSAAWLQSSSPVRPYVEPKRRAR